LPRTLTNKLSDSSEITEVFCFFPLSLITLSRSFGLLPLQTDIQEAEASLISIAVTPA
jgi:hypothetical protein